MKITVGRLRKLIESVVKDNERVWTDEDEGKIEALMMKYPGSWERWEEEASLAADEETASTGDRRSGRNAGSKWMSYIEQDSYEEGGKFFVDTPKRTYVWDPQDREWVDVKTVDDDGEQMETCPSCGERVSPHEISFHGPDIGSRCPHCGEMEDAAKEAYYDSWQDR